MLRTQLEASCATRVVAFGFVVILIPLDADVTRDNLHRHAVITMCASQNRRKCFFRSRHVINLSDPLNPGPLSQHLRDDDAAVGLLLVFEEDDHGSRDRDGGIVERVDGAALYSLSQS